MRTRKRSGTVGHAAPLMFLGAASLAAAALVVVAVRDPARPQEQVNTHIGSPHRTPVLWRLHAACALLIISSRQRLRR